MTTYVSPRMPPHRMTTDSNTMFRWTFTEALAPFASTGGTGGTLNFTGFSSEGNTYNGGQPDGLFGLGLKMNMGTQATAITRTSNYTWADSQISISVWVTLSRLLGAGNIGRIFWKGLDASNVGGFSLGFVNSSNDFTYLVRLNGGGTATSTLSGASKTFPLWMPQHIGLTYGDGNLTCFLNGQQVSQTASATALDIGTGPICIGSDFASNANQAGFILHEARLCKVVRPASWWLEAWQRGRGEWAA